MSLLLKAGEITVGSGRRPLVQGAVTPIHAAQTGQPEQRAALTASDARPDGQIESLKHRVAELERAYEEQTRHVETLKQEAYQRGIDAGIESGVARAENDHTAMLDRLEAGVKAALAALHERLQVIEVLALDVAQSALEKVIGDPASYTALIGQTVRHHLAQTAAGSAVGIRVSADDFADPVLLKDTFATLTRHTLLAVKADPQLRSGACVIELTLGRLDLSLPQQMTRIVTALDGLRADD
jgi:flagellar assembly protein FliH